MRASSASASANSAAFAARRSTSSRQVSATTLGRVPPAMTPTLQVTVGHCPFRAWSDSTSRAAARIALRPFSGSIPAWAARPLTVTASSAMPFRALTMSPLARAHSRTRAAWWSAASDRMTGPEKGEPISSSGLATNVTAGS